MKLYNDLMNAVNNSEKALCELVIRGQADDIMEAILNKINEMELKVIPVYNKLVLKAESFYSHNKHLARKDYAIKAKDELGMAMSLAMNLYIGKPNNYEEFAIKHMSTLFLI